MPTTFTRRGFINTVTISGAATTISPLNTFAASGTGTTRLADKIKVVSNTDLSENEKKRILAVSEKIELHQLTNSNQSMLDEAEIIIGDINAAMLKRTKKLKWVQTTAAGVEWMSKEVIEHPFILTNMQRIFAPVIAETAIGMLLSLTRGIAQFAVPNFMKKKWEGTPPDDIVLDDIYNKTIAIVGMGGIGSETARRLHYGFGMKVIATDAKPMPRPDFVEELHDPTWLMEMVPQADVLMSAAPLTGKTKQMFNEAVFSRMKPTAYFINVSRGGLVQQDALVNALKNKKIRGASLDVATPEPLPASDPLWTCPNLVITSHNSGHAKIRHERATALIEENLKRYVIGEPLMNVVDKNKGY